MNDTSKFLIEQEVYGIKEESGFVDGNEYITESIMEYLDTDSPTYTLMDTLFESIEYSNDFSFYTPLLEAADESKNLETLTDELKRTRDPKKIEEIEKRSMKTVSRLGKWFMSLDPEKKGKTWCTVVKILINVIGAALDVCTFGGAIVVSSEDGMIGLALMLASYAATSIGVIAYTLEHDKKIEYNMAGYEENLRKWDDELDKIDELISKVEEAKKNTTDPVELKTLNKRLADLNKTKASFEKAIKKLIKLKKEETYTNAERAADRRAQLIADSNK